MAARKDHDGRLYQGIGEDPREWLSRLERLRSENRIRPNDLAIFNASYDLAKRLASELHSKLLATVNIA